MIILMLCISKDLLRSKNVYVFYVFTIRFRLRFSRFWDVLRLRSLRLEKRARFRFFLKRKRRIFWALRENVKRNVRFTFYVQFTFCPAIFL